MCLLSDGDLGTDTDTESKLLKPLQSFVELDSEEDSWSGFSTSPTALFNSALARRITKNSNTTAAKIYKQKKDIIVTVRTKRWRCCGLWWTDTTSSGLKFE